MNYQFKKDELKEDVLSIYSSEHSISFDESNNKIMNYDIIDKNRIGKK